MTNPTATQLPTTRISATFERHDAFHGSYDIITATNGEVVVNYYPDNNEDMVKRVGDWMPSREDAHRAVALHSLLTVARPLLRAHRAATYLRDVLPVAGRQGGYWAAIEAGDSYGHVAGRWASVGATPAQASLNAWNAYTAHRANTVAIAADLLRSR